MHLKVDMRLRNTRSGYKRLMLGLVVIALATAGAVVYTSQSAEESPSRSLLVAPVNPPDSRSQTTDRLEKLQVQKSWRDLTKSDLTKAEQQSRKNKDERLALTSLSTEELAKRISRNEKVIDALAVERTKIGERGESGKRIKETKRDLQIFDRNSAVGRSSVEQSIAKLRFEEKDLLIDHGPKHPDVLALRQRIQQLQQIAEKTFSQASASAESEKSADVSSERQLHDLELAQIALQESQIRQMITEDRKMLRDVETLENEARSLSAHIERLRSLVDHYEEAIRTLEIELR